MSSSQSFSLQRHEGRLIEARVFELRDREESNRYSEALRAETLHHVAPSVLCADHRPVRIYAPEAAERLTQLFVAMNARLVRVAILVAPSNATLLLQLERIVREARFESRRVFTQPDPAIEHLRGALEPGELARARTFLGEYTVPA